MINSHPVLARIQQFQKETLWKVGQLPHMEILALYEAYFQAEKELHPAKGDSVIKRSFSSLFRKSPAWSSHYAAFSSLSPEQKKILFNAENKLRIPFFTASALGAIDEPERSEIITQAADYAKENDVEFRIIIERRIGERRQVKRLARKPKDLVPNFPAPLPQATLQHVAKAEEKVREPRRKTPPPPAVQQTIPAPAPPVVIRTVQSLVVRPPLPMPPARDERDAQLAQRFALTKYEPTRLTGERPIEQPQKWTGSSRIIERKGRY